MKFKNPFIQNAHDKTMAKIEKAEAYAEKIANKKYANRSLDRNAKTLCNAVKMAGADAVRNRFIPATESEIKELVAKGKTDEEILQPCRESPNYQQLLVLLGMNMEHLKVMIKEVRKNLTN